MAQSRTVDRRAGRAVLARPVRTAVTLGGAVLLAAAAALFSLAAVVRNRAPEMVPGFWPEPLAPMTSWSQRLIAEPAHASDPQTRAVAIHALQAQPLTPPALQLLAIWEKARGNERAADRMADLSQRLSRRDLGTQLFQIERRVAQGDVAGALVHYDIALRTSPDSQRLLFPVLTAAISDPAIRSALIPYVRQRAPWLNGFLFNALDVQGGAVSVAMLLTDPRVGKPAGMTVRLAPVLITRLIDLGELDLATRLFLRLPNADRAMLADITFTNRTTDPAFGPFAWHPVNAPDASAVFDVAGAVARRLVVSAAGAIGSQIVLQRVIALPPGDYRFSERRGADETGQTNWRISCLRGGKGREPIWASADAVAGKPADVRIPATCSWQRIDLEVSPGTDGGAVSLVVDRLILSPAGDVTANRRAPLS